MMVARFGRMIPHWNGCPCDPPCQTKKTLRLIRISRISDSNFRCWAGA